MMAITDDAGAFELDYLGHIGSGFASIEDAKSAAPEFARAVLERLRNLIQDVLENAQVRLSPAIELACGSSEGCYSLPRI